MALSLKLFKHSRFMTRSPKLLCKLSHNSSKEQEDGNRSDPKPKHPGIGGVASLAAIRAGRMGMEYFSDTGMGDDVRALMLKTLEHFPSEIKQFLLEHYYVLPAATLICLASNPVIREAALKKAKDAKEKAYFSCLSMLLKTKEYEKKFEEAIQSIKRSKGKQVDELLTEVGETHNKLKHKYAETKLKVYLKTLEIQNLTLAKKAVLVGLKLVIPDALMRTVETISELVDAFDEADRHQVSFKKHGYEHLTIPKVFFALFALDPVASKDDLLVYVHNYFIMVITNGGRMLAEKTSIPVFSYNPEDVYAIVDGGFLMIVFPVDASEETNEVKKASTFKVNIIN